MRPYIIVKHTIVILLAMGKLRGCATVVLNVKTRCNVMGHGIVFMLLITHEQNLNGIKVFYGFSNSLHARVCDLQHSIMGNIDKCVWLYGKFSQKLIDSKNYC